MFFRESRIKEANYKKATMLLSSKEFDDAKSLFSDLGYYSDSKNMVKECDYQKAIHYYENSNYADALSKFKSLSQYKKSAEYVALCDFHIAKYSISYDDIEKLTTVMNGLLKYANSNIECKNCCADSLFTFMKLFNSEFSYSGMNFKFYQKKDDPSFWMTYSYDFWDSYNHKYWGSNENKGKYGLITFTKSEDGPYIDWIEIVDFDDPYTDKPSTVTVKNPK